MLTLRDLMVSDLVTVPPDATLREVAGVLLERRISGAPVVDAGRIVGLVSMTDVIETASTASTSRTEAPARLEWEDPAEDELWVDESAASDYFSEVWSGVSGDQLERFEEILAGNDFLDSTTAGEVMTRRLHVLGAETAVATAATYMLDAGIHRIFVSAGNGPVGLVTMTDFARAVAEGLLEEGCARPLPGPRPAPPGAGLAMDDHSFHVTLERAEGYAFTGTFDRTEMGCLRLDEPAPLGAGSAPNPTRLLAAAIGDCLASSLLFCLGKARIRVDGLRVEVSGRPIRNERGRLRVPRIDVVLKPRVRTVDLPSMRRCLGLYEDFCTVTQSVRPGIDVRASVEPVVIDEPARVPAA